MTRILIVEDSPTQAEQLRLVLDAEGFEVQVANDAERALRMFEDSNFDMVVSDIVMPGLSGYDLCRRLKANPRGRDVPVILVSTLNDPMDIIHGLECHADNFVTKPYEPDFLVTRIKTVLENLQIRTAGKFKIGVDVMFLGRKFSIASDKEHILDLLMSTFEDTVRTNRRLKDREAELAAAKAELERHAGELEERVAQRTSELQQAQKMEVVGQLTGGIAHDFNNLLSVIIGNLDLLQQDLADRPQGLEIAEMALTAALRGAELTNQLLAFSRRQQLQPRAISLNEIAGIAAMLRRVLGEKIQIDLQLGHELWPAEADPAQVESALTNLAINARDAMPEGGKLIIETANKHLDADYAADNPDVTPGDYVMLAVTDTGSGIPARLLPHVFEPFFTTKGVGKGTGLGLSMVYGFAKQSGGHVKIYSEEGHGTTVRLYLPRAKGETRAPAPAAMACAERGGTETVLVVEDDADVRKTAVRQLSGLGYSVLQAENGQRALEMLRGKQRIDLLFTDMIMPGMSGADLAREARKRRSGLRVLFTSGFTETSLQNPTKLPDGAHLLSKPYRRGELAAKVREVLTG